mgnify:CR=1 FL=1
MISTASTLCDGEEGRQEPGARVKTRGGRLGSAGEKKKKQG